MPWPLEALCLYPLWHPMLCPWEISVLSCGHWRGRDKVEHSCFPACCQPRGAQSPGRAVSRCDPCPGTLPAVLPMEGTQPQPPAPLWHPGDCEGLFSYAGSGSDCRVLSNISSHLYSGMNPLWLFFFPSLLDGQHSEDARLSSSRACVAARGWQHCTFLLPAPGWHCQGLFSVHIPSCCHAGTQQAPGMGHSRLQQLCSGTGTARGSGYHRVVLLIS